MTPNHDSLQPHYKCPTNHPQYKHPQTYNSHTYNHHPPSHPIWSHNTIPITSSQ